MKEIRITVRCLASPMEHAKIVRVKARLGRRKAEELADLLDGTSLAYVHPPGPKSPVGRCIVCGNEVECEISEIVDGKPVEPTGEEAARIAERREKKGERQLKTQLATVGEIVKEPKKSAKK